MPIQILLEKRHVDEMRDGCIYRTHSLGEEWVPIGTPCYVLQPDGTMYCSLSCTRLAEVQHQTMRSI